MSDYSINFEIMSKIYTIIWHFQENSECYQNLSAATFILKLLAVIVSKNKLGKGEITIKLTTSFHTVSHFICRLKSVLARLNPILVGVSHDWWRHRVPGRAPRLRHPAWLNVAPPRPLALGQTSAQTQININWYQNSARHFTLPNILWFKKEMSSSYLSVTGTMFYLQIKNKLSQTFDRFPALSI